MLLEAWKEVALGSHIIRSALALATTSSTTSFADTCNCATRTDLSRTHLSLQKSIHSLSASLRPGTTVELRDIMENDAVDPELGPSYPERYSELYNKVVSVMKSTNSASSVPGKVLEDLGEGLHRDTYRNCWWAVQDLPPPGTQGGCGTFLEVTPESEDPDADYKRRSWAAKYVRNWEAAAKPAMASPPRELSSPDKRECYFRSLGATVPHAGAQSAQDVCQRRSVTNPRKLLIKRTTGRKKFKFLLFQGFPGWGASRSRSVHFPKVD